MTAQPVSETTDAPSQAPFEEQLRDFFGKRGADLDAMSVMYLLFRTDSVTLSAMEANALKPHGLTHAGFVLMMTLWVMGPQEPRNLAWMQSVTRPSIVSAVDTLERAGLVRRERSEVDRRLVTVELTDQGTTTIERAHHDFHNCEKKITSVLSTREQRSLAGMLRKIEQAARDGVCDNIAGEA